jgi:transcriptional regulator with XRE-family HTH domain
LKQVGVRRGQEETRVRQAEDGAIGGRIARARKESGLTQEELAALVGVSPRSIQGYEAGKVVPYRRMGQLAQAVNREVGWMLEGDPPDDAIRSDEVAQQLVGLVEEVSAEAKRIRAIAERLERLLGGARPPA